MTYRTGGAVATAVAAFAFALIFVVTTSIRATECRAAKGLGDAVVVSELHRAMIHLEDYKAQFGSYPATTDQLATGTGFHLSSGLRWKAFRRKTGEVGTESVWMVIGTSWSPDTWQADYPANGTEVTAR